MFRGRKRAQRDRREAWIIREGVEHTDERMPLVGLGLAVAPDEERRRRAETAHDVLQGLDRDLGGVQVLEDQDERLSGGDSRESPREQLEDLDAIFGFALTGRSDFRIAAHGRTQLADLRQQREKGEQLRREVGKVGPLGRGAPGVFRLKVVLDELAETLIGEGPVLLDESAVQDADPADRSELFELLQKPRLADPRLTGQDGELTGARDRGIQPMLQLGEFFFAADERRRGRPLISAARRSDDRHPGLVAREAGAVAAQRLRELPGLLGTTGRVLLQTLKDDRLKLLADLRTE